MIGIIWNSQLSTLWNKNNKKNKITKNLKLSTKGAIRNPTRVSPLALKDLFLLLGKITKGTIVNPDNGKQRVLSGLEGTEISIGIDLLDSFLGSLYNR